MVCRVHIRDEDHVDVTHLAPVLVILLAEPVEEEELWNAVAADLEERQGLRECGRKQKNIWPKKRNINEQTKE